MANLPRATMLLLVLAWTLAEEHHRQNKPELSCTDWGRIRLSRLTFICLWLVLREPLHTAHEISKTRLRMSTIMPCAKRTTLKMAKLTLLCSCDQCRSKDLSKVAFPCRLVQVMGSGWRVNLEIFSKNLVVPHSMQQVHFLLYRLLSE